MSNSSHCARSPMAPPNGFESLIRHIKLLSESILSSVKLDPVLVHNVTCGHVMFTQTKSIAIIVKRLRELIQLTQIMTNHLARYRRIVERLLFDFRRDMQLSKRCCTIREKQRLTKSHANVQDVFVAEYNVMRHLKRTMDKQLHRIHFANQELSYLRTHLSHLKDQHISLLDGALRTRRLLHSTANDVRLESKLATFLNETYPSQWNPNGLLKNIESSHDRANRIRTDLINLLDRLPRYVQETRSTLYESLTWNSANIFRESVTATLADLSQKKAQNRCRGVECKLRAQDPIDSAALKSVRDQSHELEEHKRQLDQLHARLCRDMELDLQLLRLRKREQKERIFPLAIVYPLCKSSFPSVISRSSTR